MFKNLNNETIFSYILIAVIIFFGYAIVSSGRGEITAHAYHNLDVSLSKEGRKIALKLYKSHLPHMLTWRDYYSTLSEYMTSNKPSKPMDKKSAALWLKNGEIQ